VRRSGWPKLTAAIVGVVAIVGIQLLFVGSANPWLACSAFTDITGAVLIGLAPLMLAFLILAALANVRASGPDKWRAVMVAQRGGHLSRPPGRARP
jgi:hypothetical protein